MIDSHCHLDFKDFDIDRAAVLDRARQAGVAGFICIGAGGDLLPATACVGLAEVHPDIVATVGIHPHDAAALDEEMWANLGVLAAHPRVVGVGESGLDYHYDRSPRPVQQEAFLRFAHLAQAHDRALVCHVREAHADALEVLARAGQVRGVIHSFTGDRDDARRYLDRGLYLSFSGIVTFKKADSLRDAAAFAPAERILVETDAPYLAPVPLRGGRNEPAFLSHTLRVLADVRGVTVEELGAQTVTNTRAAFGLSRSFGEAPTPVR